MTSTDTSLSPAAVDFREAQLGDDMSAFRTLNEQWISEYFVLEQKDRDQLDHPQAILERGGHIYFAYLGDIGIGCIALVAAGNGAFELSKMAVSARHRGVGVGRRMLEHTIHEARRLGAKTLFLGSNTRLGSAMRLYEAAGFQHLPPERVPKLGYNRANVFMELELT